MAQPPIQVDQISAAPAFDGTNITNVDADLLGGINSSGFATLTTNSFVGLQTIDTAPSVGGPGVRVHGNQPSIQMEDTTLSTNPWDIRVTQNDFRVIDGASGMSILALKGAGVGARNTIEVLAADITFGGTSILYTTTTTTTEGVIELATQVEVDAGSDTTRAVTPNTLANYSGLGGGGGVMFTGTSGIINSPVVEGASRYSSPSGRATGQTIESSSVREIVPYQPNGPAVVTVSNLFVKTFNNTTTSPVTVTLFKNGVATAVVATVGAGSTTVASDISNSFTCTPNDGISMRWTSAGAGGTFGIASWGFSVT